MYFSLLYLFVGLAILFFTDFFFRSISEHNKLLQVLSALLFTFVTIFFYSELLINPVFGTLKNFIPFIKARYLILKFLAVLSVLLLSKKIRIPVRIFLNRTVFFCSVLLTLQLILKKEAKSNFQIQTRLPENYPAASNSKPIVLIIMDELASPAELYRISKRKEVFSFEETLAAAGYLVRENFVTHEKSTVHVLNSLLNLNTSHYGNSSGDYFEQLDGIKNCSIADELQKKGVEFVAYSFVKTGTRPQFRYILPDPENFVELILYNSILERYYLTTNKKFGNIARDIRNDFSAYNEDLTRAIPGILNTYKNTKTVIYIHLLMPHKPFSFGNEIHLKNSDLSSYISYYIFSTQKITELLMKSEVTRSYRVVISGDHGFRNSHEVDPYQTFSGFYGFDSSAVNMIHCTDDLGKFIVASFK